MKWSDGSVHCDCGGTEKPLAPCGLCGIFIIWKTKNNSEPKVWDTGSIHTHHSSSRRDGWCHISKCTSPLSWLNTARLFPVPSVRVWGRQGRLVSQRNPVLCGCEEQLRPLGAASGALRLWALAYIPISAFTYLLGLKKKKLTDLLLHLRHRFLISFLTVQSNAVW